MKRLVALLLAAGCATTSTKAPPTVEACSLADETRCVAFGAVAAPSVATPSGQLVVGLAGRAATLPPEEAVDYWRRIVEIVDTSQQSDRTVNRRAAPSYAALALLDVSDVGAEADVMEEALAESQAAVEHVRKLAEFAVKYGEPATQARGARAIADAYARQADALAAFELPTELTQDGRTTLAGKRDGLVRELRGEVELLHIGLREHCNKHQLKLAECETGAPAASQPSSAQPSSAPAQACGVRVGMPASAVAALLGDPDEAANGEADCVIQTYSGLRVTLCFDTVRDVRRSGDCP